MGCHGQTLYHQGEACSFLGRKLAVTWQTGEGAVLAARVGVPVVSDFRPADMAAGGKGAPLVPFLDFLLYRDPSVWAELCRTSAESQTSPPSRREPSADRVMAFDTGPGNMVIDAVTQQPFDKPYDRDGRIAGSGTVLDGVIRLHLCVHHSFVESRRRLRAAKNLDGSSLQEFMRRCGRADKRDIVATATALTASSIADASRRFVVAAKAAIATSSFPAAARKIRLSWQCWRMNCVHWACRFVPPMNSGCPRRRKKRRLSRCWLSKHGIASHRTCHPRPGQRGPRFWERFRMRERTGVSPQSRECPAEGGCTDLAFDCSGTSCSPTCRCSAKPDPNTLVMIIESSPTNLDPRVGLDAQSERIDELLFDDLCTRDEHLNVQPGLAERWEIPDPLTYVFHLHQGRKISRWARALTSRDVKWTFDSLLQGKIRSTKAAAYRLVDHIDAPDDYTVVFHLKEPFATFVVECFGWRHGHRALRQRR